MRDSKKKWWLALVLICCLAPATFADQEQHQRPDRDNLPGQNHGCDPRDERCQPRPIPEGGSTTIYLVGAGLTCFGAMLLRSKQAELRRQSRAKKDGPVCE